MNPTAIRRELTRWYQRNQRDLPWRRTRDPYSIWISEIMLQQTRVAAVIPYYERFLARFDAPHALADAPEAEVLALWSGLGYYSRARNMQKAARQIVERGRFPQDYASIRELAGVGDYTAAAVASIAFGLPHAVVDGNVRRVLMRLTNDASADVQGVARILLDRKNPGQWNQAVMELGATVCVPGTPRCGDCPMAANCEAFRAGTAAELPPKRRKPALTRKQRTLLVIRRRGTILLAPSPRVKGFWELPEPDAFTKGSLKCYKKLGTFRHSITSSQYLFEVVEGRASGTPPGFKWCRNPDLEKIPLSTAAKKALRCL